MPLGQGLSLIPQSSDASGPATQVAAYVPAGRRDPRPVKRRRLPKERQRRRQNTRAKGAHVSP